MLEKQTQGLSWLLTRDEDEPMFRYRVQPVVVVGQLNLHRGRQHLYAFWIKPFTYIKSCVLFKTSAFYYYLYFKFTWIEGLAQ